VVTAACGVEAEELEAGSMQRVNAFVLVVADVAIEFPSLLSRVIGVMGRGRPRVNSKGAKLNEVGVGDKPSANADIVSSCLLKERGVEDGQR
jgi:hypothetical protein